MVTNIYFCSPIYLVSPANERQKLYNKKLIDAIEYDTTYVVITLIQVFL